MPFQLIITNMGYGLSIFIVFIFGSFVYLKNPKVQTNVVFLFFVIAWVIFQLSYVVGINISDPNLSRLAFMFNLSTLFIPTLTTHIILCVTKTLQKMKGVLITVYSISVLLIIFFILNQDRFLLPSSPKIYYKNFFVLGDLYFIGDIFFYSILLLSFLYIFYLYYKTNKIERNKLRYFIVAIISGFIFASLPAFLLYDINIDPFWSFLAGPVYIIPMAYAIIQYEIIDIKIVAKRALLYGMGVGLVMFFFIILNSINNRINEQFPMIPLWVMPLLSSLIAVSIGIFIWNKIREVDILKYEFINIIMHKFRTPLTAVKWSLDTLEENKAIDSSGYSEQERNAIETIRTANVHLITLTNTVAGLTFLENRDYQYNLEKTDLTEIVENINLDLLSKIKKKSLNVTHIYDKDFPEVKLDKEKIKFAFQTIMENAINYTAKEGNVDISLKRNMKYIYFIVKDSGIGISREDLPHIFSKFFRGKGARTADTEGMGIGLHLTKDIIRRHGGKILAESDGYNKGTTITIQLPIVK